MNIAYILCLYKKDRLRGDFGILQSGPKGVISEIGVAFWSYLQFLISNLTNSSNDILLLSLYN